MHACKHGTNARGGLKWPNLGFVTFPGPVSKVTLLSGRWCALVLRNDSPMSCVLSCCAEELCLDPEIVAKGKLVSMDGIIVTSLRQLMAGKLHAVTLVL